MSKELKYQDYTSTWIDAFERIRDFIDFNIHDLIIDIIHVGSTSVDTLGAKPIIDIDIVFEDYIDEIIETLSRNGYEYEGFKGIDGRHSFRRKTDDFYEHHLYACHKDSDELKKHLTFKRALQNNPQYRIAYSNLKQKLIKENNKDRVLYTNSKSALIESILKEESIMKSIVLAGGCFWGVEAYFKQLNGVNYSEVGYIDGGGSTTYKEVCEGGGHAEAVLLRYDETLISLKKILDHMFNIIDPTSINKQGNDRGVQYRSGIYNYHDEQHAFIKNYLNIRQKEYSKPFAIDIKNNLTFYSAEDYHQEYLGKNKNGYCHVDLNSHSNVE